MTTNLSMTPEYRDWIGQLKTRFRSVQLKAAVAVNHELLQFYWELGAGIVSKQTEATKGQFVQQPVAQLPTKRRIAKQPVSQFQSPSPPELLSIPWGQSLAILAPTSNSADVNPQFELRNCQAQHDMGPY
jgi:hypothetical protein